MPNPQLAETLTIDPGQLLIAEFQAARLDELTAERRKQHALQTGQELEGYLDRLRNEQGNLPDPRYLGEHELAMVGMFALVHAGADEVYQKTPKTSRFNPIGGQEAYQGRTVVVTAREEGSLPVEVLRRDKYSNVEVIHNRIASVQGRIVARPRYDATGGLELFPARSRNPFRNVSRYVVNVVSPEAIPLVDIEFID